MWLTWAVTLLTLHVLVTSCNARMNVLFLVSDDMRPELNFYCNTSLGNECPSHIHPNMVTPNLDRLASRSLVLKRAYCQLSWCSPSRTSLLTGRRPDTTHVHNLSTYWRTAAGNFTTIPQYFKEHGYQSVGMGKVFHPGKASNHNDPISWSEPYYLAPNEGYWTGKRTSWEAVPEKDYKDKPLPDQQIVEHARETLKRLAPAAKSGDKPFFVAVGVHKPHLPFIVPEKYFKNYPIDSIRLPDNPYAPWKMPELAWESFKELRTFKDIEIYHPTGAVNTTFPDNVTLALRRAYYSAITYVDDLFGMLLSDLETLGLTDNTIVSFWGDHGWQLGEHGEWTKHTNWELSVRAPMMIHIPGKTDKGIATDELTEFVDLFPTLADAAGLPPVPLCPENSTKIEVCGEGSSLMPLIDDISGDKWKSFVFSQYPRGKYMGYTLRNDTFRYTEWVKFDKEKNKPIWDDNKGVELYDLINDPEENYNRAHDKNYKTVTETLKEKLHAGWRKALPDV